MLTPASINELSFIDQIREAELDLAIVCDYGQILSPQALSAFRMGAINLHGSLLPRHRGAAPVQWSILRGDSQTGVSVIWMTPGLDAGPILSSRATAIGLREDAEQLERRLSILGADAVRETIELLRQLSSTDDLVARAVPQDERLATKAPRLKKEHGQIDFSVKADIVDRLVRGMRPWPGVFGDLEFDDGRRIRVSILAGEPVTFPFSEPSFTVGSIVSPAQCKANGLPNRLIVGCGNRTYYAIETIQPAGKKRQSAEEFGRGYLRNGHAKFAVPEKINSLLERLKKED